MAADEYFFHLYRGSSTPEESGTVELSAGLEPVREEIEEIVGAFDPADPARPSRRHARLYDASYHALTRFEAEGTSSFVARTFVVPARWLAAGGHDLDTAFEALPWELLSPPHLEALDPDERYLLPELSAPEAPPPRPVPSRERELDERLEAIVESLALTQSYVVSSVRGLALLGGVLVLLVLLTIVGLCWNQRAETSPALSLGTIEEVLGAAALHEDEAIRDLAASLYLDLVLDESQSLSNRGRDALVQEIVGDDPDGGFDGISRQRLDAYLDTHDRCCSDLSGVPRRICVLSSRLSFPREIVCAGRFPFDGAITWSAESATALLRLSRQARSAAPPAVARELEAFDLLADPGRARRLPSLVVDPGEVARLGELAEAIGWPDDDLDGQVE